MADLIAGVVVRNDQGKYVLVQEGRPHIRGLWNVPAGHVDEGEAITEAALREGFEETGLTLELLSDRPVLVDTKTHPVYDFYVYRAKVVGGELSPSEAEILDAQWLTYKEIVDLQAAGKMRSTWQLEAITKVEKS